jgi:glutathione S-transferase
LDASGDIGFVEETLEAVLAVGDDYLEAPMASEAIAAAEAVARLQGHYGQRDAYSERVDAWVQRVSARPSPALIAKAHRALDRVLAEPSELLELWQESDETAAWEGAVRELKTRLGA